MHQPEFLTIIITHILAMRFKLTVLLVIVTTALLVAACGSEPVYKIGISQCSDDDGASV